MFSKQSQDISHTQGLEIEKKYQISPSSLDEVEVAVRQKSTSWHVHAKYDEYYLLEKQWFRIRTVRKGNNAKESMHVFSFKQERRKNGLEYNTEYETQVSSPSVMRYHLFDLGARLDAVKYKRGTTYHLRSWLKDCNSSLSVECSKVYYKYDLACDSLLEDNLSKGNLVYDNLENDSIENDSILDYKSLDGKLADSYTGNGNTTGDSDGINSGVSGFVLLGTFVEIELLGTPTAEEKADDFLVVDRRIDVLAQKLLTSAYSKAEQHSYLHLIKRHQAKHA